MGQSVNLKFLATSLQVLLLAMVLKGSGGNLTSSNDDASGTGCEVNFEKLQKIESLLKRATTQLGKNQFTRTPLNWNTTCSAVWSFLHTKAKLMEIDVHNFLNFDEMDVTQLATTKTKLEKQLKVYSDLIQSLTQDYNPTVTTQELIYLSWLAQFQAQTLKLRAQVNAHVKEIRKLRNNTMIVTNLRQGNVVNALLHTPASISDHDLENALFKTLAMERENKDIKFTVLNYLIKLPFCNQTAVGIKQVVMVLKKRNQLRGENILLVDYVINKCKNNPELDSLIEEILPAAQTTIQKYTPDILKAQYLYVTWALKQMERVEGSDFLMRKPMNVTIGELYKRMKEEDTINAEFVDVAISLAIKGKFVCSNVLHGLDELLRHFEGNGFGYFMIIQQYFDPSTPKSDCKPNHADAFMQCVKDIMRNSGKLDNVRDTCLKQQEIK